MEFKKAVMLGAEVWILIFFEVSFLMFGAKLSQTSPTYYITHFILVTFFLILASLYYFNKTNSKKINGLYLGLIMTVIGIILDSVITIPLFVKDFEFLIQKNILIGYIWGIIVPTIIGIIKGK